MASIASLLHPRRVHSKLDLPTGSDLRESGRLSGSAQRNHGRPQLPQWEDAHAAATVTGAREIDPDGDRLRSPLVYATSFIVPRRSGGLIPLDRRGVLIHDIACTVLE